MAVFPNLLEIPTEYAHANSAGHSDQRAMHRICKSGPLPKKAALSVAEIAIAPTASGHT